VGLFTDNNRLLKVSDDGAI